MKVLVVGAGALGSLVGGILSKDNLVTILGRPDQVSVINSRGITIEGHTQGKYFPSAVTTPPADEIYDLIVICVKSYNTGIALESISHLLRPETYLLSLQNGLDNEETISRFIEERSLGTVLFGGITCHGVTYKEPGLVKHAGVGDTMIGLYESPPGVDAHNGLTGIADAFKHAGIQMDVVDSIEREIWAKALINSAINPLTAIRGEPNGIILDDPSMNELARSVVKEGVSVAVSHRISITEEEILSRTFRTAERTRGNSSSMLQDLRRRRRTEIEAINGAIIRKAEETGVQVPCNQTLYRLVRSLEDSYLGPKNKTS